MANGLFDDAPYEVVSSTDYLNYVQLICVGKSSGDRVKLTALNDDVLNNHEALQEFAQLTRLQKRINHPSVAGVLAIHPEGEIGDREYLVTEYLDSTLEQVIANGGLDAGKAEALILKIAKGLSAVHAAGVLHLDLKPENILVDDARRQIKIDNFGSACEIGVQITSIAMDPKYSAPEKYLSDLQISEQADIYSLGMIAYELALGPENFQAAFADIYSVDDSWQQGQRWSHWHMDMSASARLLGELVGDCSESFAKAVDRMMAKDLNARYIDLSSLLNELGGASSPVKPVVIKPISEDEPETSTTTMPWKKVVLVLLAVLLLGGGGYAGYDWYQGQQLSQALNSELARVIQKRKEAIALGATDAIPLFVTAEETLADGKGLFDAGKLQASIQALRTAFDQYVAVIELLKGSGLDSARAAYQAALAEANRVRVSPAYAGYVGATAQAEAAEASADAGELADALTAYASATEQLQEAIEQAPRRFFRGSTEAGIDAALALCRQYQDRCERQWYADEAGMDVDIAPFKLDNTEVSVAEFGAFVAATGYQTTAEVRGFSYLILGDSSSRRFDVSWQELTGLDTPHYASDQSPVLHVSFDDASAYCEWKNLRLPTEAEWEFAATAGGDRTFAWGNEWRDDEPTGLVPGEEQRLIAAVDTYGQTPEGLWGMTGGVWEWTTTEVGAGSRISKGGAWSDINPAHLRTRVRRAEEQGYSSNDIGFRCAESTQTWSGL